MTVICVRDGVMAVDRMVSQAGFLWGTLAKWVPVKRKAGGGFIACAGDASVVVPLFRSLRKFGGVEGPEDIRGLWLQAGGVVLERSGPGGWYHSAAPFYAAGDGARFAMGAMAAGASADEAVRLTCEYHLGSCGGGIDVLRI